MNYVPVLNANCVNPSTFANCAAYTCQPQFNEFTTILNDNRLFEFSSNPPEFLLPYSLDEEAFEIHKIKRGKNNDAVRKSRYKAKQRASSAEMKVKSLTDDNQSLVSIILALELELSNLKKTYEGSLQHFQNKDSYNSSLSYTNYMY